MKTQIELEDGKYTIIHENGAGLRALRYGQPWRDLTGDGLILAMAQEIEALRERAAKNTEHQYWPRAGNLEIECHPERFHPNPWHVTDGFHHGLGKTPNEALNNFNHQTRCAIARQAGVTAAAQRSQEKQK